MSPENKRDQHMRFDPQQYWRDLAVARSQIDTLVEQSKVTGELGPVTQAFEELKLKATHYEELLEEMQASVRDALGKNFLGTAEWKAGFGVNVAVPPVIPEYITAEFLNSSCPLHPGQKIKETHILMLMPKTVDGQPYSALKLDELCAARRGSGERLIFDDLSFITIWKTELWSEVAPVESQWVLIPKRDPDPRKVPADKHFRGKSIAEQAEVYNTYAHEYRQAKALEVMTAAVLHAATGGGKILRYEYLRTEEEDCSGGRVVVGYFYTNGLKVSVDTRVGGNDFGCALARR